MNDEPNEWENSHEYMDALHLYSLSQPDKVKKEDFMLSQEFANARNAFKRRIQGERY